VKVIVRDSREPAAAFESSRILVGEGRPTIRVAGKVWNKPWGAFGVRRPGVARSEPAGFEEGLELFAAAAAELELRPVVQDDEVVAVEVLVEFFDAVEVDD
jgi:hypothetical protein